MKVSNIIYASTFLMFCLLVSLVFSAIPTDTIPSKTTTTMTTTTRTTTTSTIPKTIDDVAKDVSALDDSIKTIDNRITTLNTDISSLNSSIAKMSKRPLMQLHGTEYTTNQEGKTFLQLIEEESYDVHTPIDNASCIENIYYPNTTKWVTNAMMSFLENGLYYYDFYTPNITGVYMVTATCRYNVSREVYLATSFYNTSASNIYGDYTMTWDDDNVFHEYDTSGGILNVSYNFSGIDETNLTQIGVYWNGKISSADILYFYAWNYNTSKWTLFSNSLTGQGISTTSPSISASNTIITNASQYLENGNVSIGLYISTTANCYTDKITVYAVGTETVYVNELRGSGEIHVSPSVTGNVSVSFADIINRLNGINASIISLNTSIVSMNTTMVSLFNGINSTLINMNGTINSLNTSVNQLNTSIVNLIGSVNNMNQTINGMNTSLTALTNSVNSMNQSITLLTNSINSINSSVNSLNNSIVLLNGYILSLNNSVMSMNATMTSQYISLNNTLTTMINYQNSMNASITSLNQSINYLSNNMTSYYLDLNNSIANLNSSFSNLNQNINSLNQSIVSMNQTMTNSFYNLNIITNQINQTVTHINFTTTDINTTVNAINYSVNNLNLTINYNVSINLTGNITQATDDLWIKIRNLMLILWSTKPDWYNML